MIFFGPSSALVMLFLCLLVMPFELSLVFLSCVVVVTWYSSRVVFLHSCCYLCYFLTLPFVICIIFSHCCCYLCCVHTLLCCLHCFLALSLLFATRTTFLHCPCFFHYFFEVPLLLFLGYCCYCCCRCCFSHATFSHCSSCIILFTLSFFSRWRSSCVSFFTLSILSHCSFCIVVFIALFFLHCRSYHVVFLTLSFLSHCSFCIVAPFTFQVLIGLDFILFLALLLLLFSHCSSFISLVSMVLPLPLPCVGQSSKLHHELSTTKGEFLSIFSIFLNFLNFMFWVFFSVHFVLLFLIM